MSIEALGDARPAARDRAAPAGRCAFRPTGSGVRSRAPTPGSRAPSCDRSRRALSAAGSISCSDRVEDAAVLTRALDALCRGTAVAEQPFEDGARVVLRRQRRRGGAPRQRVHVDTAVAVAAVPDQVVQVEAHLERRQRRVLAEDWRGNLVRGYPVVNVGAFGVLRVDAGQPGAGAARVIAIGPVLRGIGSTMRQPADHDHLIPERRKRREDGRQLEVVPDGLRLPVVHPGEVHRHAVRAIDERQALRPDVRRSAPSP